MLKDFTKLRESSRLLRYTIALALLALAVTIRVLLQPWLEGATLSHPTIFTCVLIVAWYCGTGPAILDAVVGYFAAEVFILDNDLASLPAFDHLPRVFLYGVLNVIILLFVRMLSREHKALRETIAERKAAEEALRESDARLNATLRHAGVGIIEAEPQHQRIIAANEHAAAILGYRPRDLLDTTLRELTPHEDRDIADHLVGELFAGKSERADYEQRFLRADGSVIWAHVTVSAVRGESGVLLRSIATIQDISERKRIEETLRRNEEQLRIATTAAELGVWSWATPTKQLTVGGSWRRLFGIPDGVPVDFDTWRRAVHPEDIKRVLSELEAAVKTGQEFNTEYRVILPGGAERWLVDRGRAWIDETGNSSSVAGVNIDITHRKRMEDELRAATISADRAKAAAEEANQAKDQFLAVLSHELRTPLSPVLAAVQLLQRDPETGEKARRALEIIRRNVELEARLIDDLLDLTRIVRGKIVLDRKAIELRTVIERVVEICRTDIESRALNFGVDYAEGSYLVFGDPSRLQQVFWNLLKNAIKFTPDGGCVGIRCRREDHSMAVEVSDSGIGIEPEVLPRIFNAFEQGDRRITRQFGGLGLGLAITKRLVEMQGGVILAQSQGAGKGAVFRVVLPLVEAPPAVADGKSAPTDQQRNAVRTRRILLVEDHGDTALTMQMLLQASGYQVETAGDVHQALTAATANDFDLLISDLGLPDGSGLTLLRTLRERGSALRAIALSGYGREEDMARSKAAGFSAHLTKPVDLDVLLKTVGEIL